MNKNWINKAILLGLSFFLAVVLVKPVGVSTQFSVISGMVHSSLDPDLIVENPDRPTGYESSNAYYDKDGGKLAKSIKKPLNYSFIFFLSIPLGAFLSHRLERKNHISTVRKKEKLGLAQTIKGLAPAFISGFLLLFGARMAGGCTSGHMMSGIMQGSISGMIFATSVFAVAIPTSILTVKKRRRG